MSSLKEKLFKIPSERVALTSETILMSYGDIKKMIKTNSAKIEKLKSSNVVINGRDSFELAKLLFLLDGEVNSILFLPHDIDKSSKDIYLIDAKINYEVYLENDYLHYKNIKDIDYKNSLKETIWIIPTSGTTKIPKLVAHTFSSLTRTTKSDLVSGNHYIWGLVFDIYRFSGIQVFLQAMLSGATLVINRSNMIMSEILNNLIKNNCNALSGTPSFWRKVLMSKEINNLDFKIITMGGEIADKNILQGLKLKFPNAKLLHIYASTEAGVGFSVKDAHAGFPKKYMDNGINGLILKLSNLQTLMIKNNKQAQTYLSSDNLYDNSGFIDTGDIVEIKGDRVYFLGRDSGAINVGGNKVQPEEVESVLLNSGFLQAALVYSKKSQIIGNIVCANLVAHDNCTDKKILKKKILKFCRENLENFKIPGLINFVDELETTQNGKLKRS